jgi:hypothetical protein
MNGRRDKGGRIMSVTRELTTGVNEDAILKEREGGESQIKKIKKRMRNSQKKRTSSPLQPLIHYPSKETP